MMRAHRQPSIRVLLGLLLGLGLVALVQGSEIPSNKQGSNEKNPLEQYGNSIMGMFNGKEAPFSIENLSRSFQGAIKGQPFEQATTEESKSEAGSEEESEYGAKRNGHESIDEYAKLISNPIALIKKISKQFNIPLDKLVDKVGKGLVVGAEACFSPIISSVKIIEKVFVPDVCRLKYICQFGTRLTFMKEYMLKLSTNLIEGSTHIKALSHGIIGRDCAETYANCEPTLQKPYDDLKETQEESSYSSEDSHT